MFKVWSDSLCFLYLFLTSSFASDWKKVYFSLLTLHCIHQGALTVANCFHGAEYFLCSELRLVAVFATNKSKTPHVSFSMFFLSNFVPQKNSKVSFYVSLCEITRTKIQTESSSKSIFFFVFYLLSGHHPPPTGKNS